MGHLSLSFYFLPTPYLAVAATLRASLLYLQITTTIWMQMVSDSSEGRESYWMNLKFLWLFIWSLFLLRSFFSYFWHSFYPLLFVVHFCQDQLGRFWGGSLSLSPLRESRVVSQSICTFIGHKRPTGGVVVSISYLRRLLSKPLVESATYTRDSQQYSGQIHNNSHIVTAYMETAIPHFLICLLHLRLPLECKSSIES